MVKHRPTKIFLRLIKLLSFSEVLISLLINIEEEYYDVNEMRGKLAANKWLALQIIRSIPGIIKLNIYWGVGMLTSYLKITIRNLFKNLGYSAINIFGLSMGIACCMIILFWVQDEFSYDDFHENKSKIFRVIQEWDRESGKVGQEWIPGPVADELKNNYPEIHNVTRLVIKNRKQISADNKSFINACAVVDTSFFSIFSFPLLSGDENSVLKSPNSIVISQSMAFKIFGSTNPLGRVLKYDDKHDFTITGIFADVPTNSHLQFDFCISYSRLSVPFFHWNDNDHKVYVQLTNHDGFTPVNSKITDLLKNHQDRCTSILKLQPLDEIHLYSLNGVDRITYIYIFSTMAFILLLIACINFMNLTTARATKRAKEVGIRKVIGSNKAQLIFQFLGESIILSFIAMIVGFVLSIILLPFINEIVGHAIKIKLSTNIIFTIISITLFTGIIAGSYPAFFLSSFNPISVMKGLPRSERGSRVTLFRKSLTIIQFSISIFFIISAISVYRQMEYTNNRDMGIDKDNIILMDMRGELKEKYLTVKEMLLKNSSINSVTSIDIPPLIFWNNTTDAVEWEGMNPNNRLSFSVKTVDYDFLKTFDAKMAEGRFFSKEIITDASDAYIVNEAAAKAMNLDSPLGIGISLYGVNGKIIGIVKDFHIESLRKEISPAIFRIRKNKANYVCVRLMPGITNKSDVIKFISETFAQIIPAYPFYYSYLSEEYGMLYEDEIRAGKITFYITILMIIISCLGLLGLASFMAEQKKKEIGMRKVLGASVKQIVAMLSNDFVKRIALSNIIAWPVAYYFVSDWLEDFAYRIELRFDIFIYAGLLSIVLALVTVSYQSIKAANANPVDSLKYE